MAFILGAADSNRDLNVVDNFGNVNFYNDIDSSFDNGYDSSVTVEVDADNYGGGNFDRFEVIGGSVFVGFLGDSDGDGGTGGPGRVHVYRNGQRDYILQNPYSPTTSADAVGFGATRGALQMKDRVLIYHDYTLASYAGARFSIFKFDSATEFDDYFAQRNFQLTPDSDISTHTKQGAYARTYHNGRFIGNGDSDQFFIYKYDNLTPGNHIATIDRHESGSYFRSARILGTDIHAADGLIGIKNTMHDGRKGCFELFDLNGNWVNTIFNTGYTSSITGNRTFRVYGMGNGRIITQYGSRFSSAISYGLKSYTYTGDEISYVSTIGPTAGDTGGNIKEVAVGDGYVFAQSTDKYAKLYDMDLNVIKDFGYIGIDAGVPGGDLDPELPMIRDGKLYWQNTVTSAEQVFSFKLPPSLDAYFTKLVKRYR